MRRILIWASLLVLCSAAAANAKNVTTSPWLETQPLTYSIPQRFAPLPPHFHRFSNEIRACGATCVIERNYGGYVGDYLLAAWQARERGQQIVINGPCESACVLFADHARPMVCITKRASFFLHKAFDSHKKRAADGKEVMVRTDFSDPPQSPDINLWVYRTYGGYPRNGLVEMTVLQARQFWPSCILHPPLPPRPPIARRQARARRAPAALSAHGLY